MGQLQHAISMLKSYVAAFDADVVDGADAAALVELFTEGERLCSAGRALAASRVDATRVWNAEGYRSAGEWLAAKTKMSQADASTALATARQLEQLPATRQAFISGDVSGDQAAAIASAATADPAAEAELLEEAGRASLRGLERTARAIRAAAERSQAEDRDSDV